MIHTCILGHIQEVMVGGNDHGLIITLIFNIFGNEDEAMKGMKKTIKGFQDFNVSS